MRIIAFLGIFAFSRCLIINKSKRALIVMLNGMLFHGLRNHENDKTPLIQTLRYYDILTNIVIMSYTIYKNPEILLYAQIVTTNFLINFFLFDYIFVFLDKEYLCDVKDIFHALTVQIPCALALEKIF
tara:strand:+ start:112 stop:495 length:384 start_codon:yes stop_codon:yes gene_type:complete